MNRRLIILVSTLLLAAAAYVLGWSTLFTVSAIEINGSTTTLNSGIVKGQKLARVEPRAVAAQFENIIPAAEIVEEIWKDFLTEKKRLLEL